MNSIKTLLAALAMVASTMGSAHAVSNCTAAQWSGADRACAIVNGSGSCASSCNAISATSTAVGCVGSQGFITVGIENAEIFNLESASDETNIIIGNIKDFKVKSLKDFSLKE